MITTILIVGPLMCFHFLFFLRPDHYGQCQGYDLLTKALFELLRSHVVIHAILVSLLLLIGVWVYFVSPDASNKR